MDASTSLHDNNNDLEQKHFETKKSIPKEQRTPRRMSLVVEQLANGQTTSVLIRPIRADASDHMTEAQTLISRSSGDSGQTVRSSIQLKRKTLCLVRIAVCSLTFLLITLIASLTAWLLWTSSHPLPVCSETHGCSTDNLKQQTKNASSDKPMLKMQAKPNAASNFIHRLPKTTKPQAYDIQIRPYVDELQDLNSGKLFKFDGRVSITLKVETAAAPNITLNAKHLQIWRKQDGSFDVRLQRVMVVGGRSAGFSSDLGIDDVIVDENKQFLVIKPVVPLHANGTYRLTINYTGTIVDALESSFGFYFTKYSTNKTDASQTKLVAVTQFQFMHARKAFPCYDEPGYKATFRVTVVRRRNWESLSNTMLEKSTEYLPEPGWVSDHYPTTPRMSTYLVAWAVHQYSSFVVYNRHHIPIRVWYPNETSERTEQQTLMSSFGHRPEETPVQATIAKIATKAVDDCEKYFDMKYPLDKMDIILVNDFPQGAMENFGLLVFYDKYADQDAMVYHEIIHQWIGNLVTAAWWDDYWIHESVATFLSFQFSHDSIDFMAEESPKVETQVPVPPVGGQIKFYSDLNFDAAYHYESKYQKAAPVLSMISAVLGQGGLKRVLRKLLKKYSSGSITRHDFYQACDDTYQESGYPSGIISFDEFLRPYIENPGFPTVQYNQLDQTLEAKPWNVGQYGSQHVISGPTKFMVPVWITTPSSDTEAIVWLSSSKPTVSLWDIVGDSKLVLPNFKKKSYCLMDVTHSFNQIFIRQDSHFEKEYTSYAAYHSFVTGHALTLASLGETSYPRLLSWFKNLINVNDNVRTTVISEVLVLDNMLKHTEIYPKWQSLFMSNFFAYFDPNIAQGDFSSNPRPADLNVLDHVCFNGYEPCRSKGIAAFNEWFIAGTAWTGFQNYSDSFITALFCGAVRHGKGDTAELLMRRLSMQPDKARADQLGLLVPALFCDKRPQKIAEAMSKIFNVGLDYQWALHNVWKFTAMNPAGIRILWEKVDELAQSHTLQTEKSFINLLSEHVISGASISFDLWAWLSESQLAATIAKWRQPSNLERFAKLAKIGDFIRFRERWLSRHLGEFRSWLDELSEPMPRTAN